jgi:hypothetical protein
MQNFLAPNEHKRKVYGMGQILGQWLVGEAGRQAGHFLLTSLQYSADEMSLTNADKRVPVVCVTDGSQVIHD